MPPVIDDGATFLDAADLDGATLGAICERPGMDGAGGAEGVT